MPPKESIYFTKNQIQMLCELYQEEDNLWNIISPDYHKKDKKNSSLERIKEKMVEEYPDIQPFTVGQVWDKLANLRSYYCKELKKVTDSKKSGTGTDEVYTSKWCHFESLDSFLRAQVIPRRSTTNLDTSIPGDVGSEDDGNNTDSSTTSVSQPPSQPPKRIVSGTKRKLSRPEAVMEQACNVLSRLSETQRSAAPPVFQDDDDDIFGKHVAREMKKIKNERSKSLARCRIQSILFEAQYDEPVPAPVPGGNFHAGAQTRFITSQTEPHELHHPAGIARDATPSSLNEPTGTYRRTFFSL